MQSALTRDWCASTQHSPPPRRTEEARSDAKNKAFFNILDCLIGAAKETYSRKGSGRKSTRVADGSEKDVLHRKVRNVCAFQTVQVL